MTIEDLKAFLNAADRNLSIRREIKQYCLCDNKKLLSLASKYGFSITEKDLNDAIAGEKIDKWFNESQIKPFRTN